VQAGHEIDAYVIGAATEDWLEGTTASMEKRSPVFKGR
jgi:hypothetical protein